MVATVALLASAACVPIPHTHTKQPRVDFEVTRSDGTRVPGADGFVYSAIIISGRAEIVAHARTDSGGHARIARVREFHLVYGLIPDMEAPWVWAWCVSAPGFNRQAGRWSRPPSNPVRIRLVAPDSAPQCPAKPYGLDEVAPRER